MLRTNRHNLILIFFVVTWAFLKNYLLPSIVPSMLNSEIRDERSGREKKKIEMKPKEEKNQVFGR